MPKIGIISQPGTDELSPRNITLTYNKFLSESAMVLVVLGNNIFLSMFH